MPPSTSTDEVAEEARNAGVDTFVPKPLFAGSVMDEFREAFKRKSANMTREAADLKGRHILLAEDAAVNAEIMVMAIGDLAYDNSPIQMSQFESDIRIAENLDKIYFENGGGGNDYESYTAAWYMGLNHCKLDCWKRGKKGLIITMGDELINPHLPLKQLNRVTGDTNQKDIETSSLYKEASEKFDIYHICVESRSYPDQTEERKSFSKVIGDQHALVSNVKSISEKIINIVEDFSKQSGQSIFVESAPCHNSSDNGEIAW